MQSYLKKMLPAAATSLVAFTSIAHAESESAQMRNLENRVTALEQRKGANGVITPSGRPGVKNGADVFIFGDVLIWQAHEGGLALTVNSEGTGTNLHEATTSNLEFEFDWGLRLGIGYNMPHDGWDIKLTWLRILSHAHKKKHAHNGDLLWPVQMHPGIDGGLNDEACLEAKDKLKILNNQLDLDLGREFFVSKWLTLRPHMGLRTTWIRQTNKLEYENFIVAGNPDVEGKQKNSWWGIGPEAGINTLWMLGGGWSFYGVLDAAILYGFHSLDLKNEVEDSGTKFADVEDSYRISHPILDMEIGIRWDRNWCNGRYHLGLHGGWEQHIYFSQNQFMRFLDDQAIGSFIQNQGDLTYQGWTFGLRFDF